MKVIHSIAGLPSLDQPTLCTIGVYDGLHLGHQMILKELYKQSKTGEKRIVLTFSNHPSTYLKPNTPTPLLIPFNHRLKLLEKEGIDLVVVLRFDAQIANQSYEDFFHFLCANLPIKHLIVGEDARFGKDRRGGKPEIEALNLFKITYLSKKRCHKELISSEMIRFYLEKGDLKKVKKMLGRPYSLRLPFDPLNIAQEDSVQYKWYAQIKNISPLPPGVYAVNLRTQGKKIPGIVFYRSSRSINHETTTFLTLIFEKKPLPADEIEIIFLSYLHHELGYKGEKTTKTNLLETLKMELLPS